jgi:Uma2 family endonuclease
MATLPVEPWSPSLAEFLELQLFAREHLDVKLELLDGIVTAKPMQSPEHEAVVEFLIRLFVASTSDDVRVRPDMVLVLEEGWVPKPDVAVVPRGTPNTLQHPATAPLACECAVSSAKHDFGRKRHAYARAGVGEYWIVRPREHRVDVFRDPVESDYRQHFTAATGTVECSTVAGLRLDLDALWRYVFEISGR